MREQSAIDVEFLGLEVEPDDPTRASFDLSAHLCRFDGQLYGGTALAAGLAAFEIATKRPAIWTTVQFVSTAQHGERIDLVTDVVAHGRRVDQVQLHARVDGRLIFSALGSTGDRRDGMAGTAPAMPRVPGPDQERLGGFGTSETGEMGWHLVAELGEVPLLDAPDGDRGRMAIWARLRNRTQTTPASLAFLADMVPVAVARACGVLGAGISLDNALRVGRLVDTDWVLLELVAHTADAGFGPGEALLWAPDGTLMATGSQTAKMFAMRDRR